MRQVVRGGTIKELEINVASRERTGWKRITENKLDDSMGAYGHISWVCVMEIEEAEHHSKKKWGRMSPTEY